MGKVKESIQKVYDDCQAIYENGGYAKVFDHVAIQKSEGNPDYADVVEERCNACEGDMPSLNHICLICGQETKPMKYTLVDEAIKNLKADILAGDVTVLDELLSKLSVKTLVQALPEEEWEKYKELNNSYFEINAQGWNAELQREEIQIHCGENGNLLIVKTDEGFVVDVYDVNGDNLNTMAIWEDDINPLDED